MAKKNKKKLVEKLNYIDSQAIVFQRSALKTKYKIQPDDIFHTDDDEALALKEEFLVYYESLDNDSKEQIEAILLLIRNDVRVVGLPNKDDRDSTVHFVLKLIQMSIE